MRSAVLALTEGGCRTGRILANRLPDAVFYSCRGRMQETLTKAWHEYEGLICIMATGIVVRLLAPLLDDKRRDPAVVVCDEKGRFAVSLLSGHLGGGNALAQEVAALLGGQAVITTASDVLGHTPLDLWVRELGLTAAEPGDLTTAMGKLVNTGSVTLYSDYPLPELPWDIRPQGEPGAADLIITCRTDLQVSGTLLHPKILVAGIGCNRNTSEEEIARAVSEACSRHHLAPQSIRSLASIDLKRDEPGLLQFADRNGYAINFFSPAQLNDVDGISTSMAVFRATGAKGVAEPAAMLAAGGRLLVNKMKSGNVTVALAEVNSNRWDEQCKGTNLEE